LSELKDVFKTDAGLEFNVSKTSILPKGVTAQTVFDMVQTIMQPTPTLTHLSNNVLLDSFCPEGFIGIGVSIVTDAFVRSFVAKTCRDIIAGGSSHHTKFFFFCKNHDFSRFLINFSTVVVVKHTHVVDPNYQLLRFCQTTRLQYINSHIMLPNRCVLQQQHVDCKIDDVLLKKGTKQHADGWDLSCKDWAYMCIHLPNAEVSFDVTFNDVTEDTVFYTTTSRFVS
jgi:hypothetical protein